MVNDDGDIIAGDKGTGKTALYRILKERYRERPELEDVEVVPAFNPQGTPVFQRLLETDALDESQYIGVWKAYFLSLAGNWILGIYDEPDWSDQMRRLDRLLEATQLRSPDDSASTIFAKVANLLRRVLRPKSIEGSATFTETGMPIVSAKIDFTGESGIEEDDGGQRYVRYDDALLVLNAVLKELDLCVWLVLDRLDEAFQSRPSHETPALRALLRTYLDIQDLEHLRCKIFVRRDLFRRIIGTGFVNLTHINARKIEIIWDTEDLFELLSRRVKDSGEFLSSLGLGEHTTSEEMFRVLFPDQVDQGSRKPATWNWMIERIRDGNGVRPPRNLIDLVTKAQDSQLRAEDRELRPYRQGVPLIGSEALKNGLSRLSETRVEDTLLAEAGEYAARLIERFRDGKAEHNAESLHELLGERYRSDAKLLEQLGFLESVGSNWKVPMLYRAGMRITQGRAYAASGTNANAEEPEF